MKKTDHWRQFVTQTFLTFLSAVSPTFLSAGLILVLTSGCAHQPAQTQPTFSDLPPQSLTPTSDRENAAVMPAAGGASSVAAPPGAPPEDWALAETIRAELTKDKKLVHAPMEAVVNNGTVTLRGYAPTKRARQQIHERIASLPGVKQVEDQIQIKNTAGSWPGVSRDFDQNGK